MRKNNNTHFISFICMFVFGAREDKEDVTCLADLVRLRVRMTDMPAKIKALQAEGKATWELHTKDVYVDVVCECLRLQKLYPETAAQTLRILAKLPGAVPLTVTDIKRAGLDCWQWSVEEHGAFEAVVFAVATNMATLKLDVEELLHWLDEHRATMQKLQTMATPIGSWCGLQYNNYATRIGSCCGLQGNHAMPIGYSGPVTVTLNYYQQCQVISAGIWKCPPKCLVRAIVQARWSGRRAAWLAACCQI